MGEFTTFWVKHRIGFNFSEVRKGVNVYMEVSHVFCHPWVLKTDSTLP